MSASSSSENYKCVLCPEEKCAPNCLFRLVLPASPNELEKHNNVARKLRSNFKRSQLLESLQVAEESGLDLQVVIQSFLQEIESWKKYPEEGSRGLLRELKKTLKEKEDRLSKQKLDLEVATKVLDDEKENLESIRQQSKVSKREFEKAHKDIIDARQELYIMSDDDPVEEEDVEDEEEEEEYDEQEDVEEEDDEKDAHEDSDEDNVSDYQDEADSDDQDEADSDDHSPKRGRGRPAGSTRGRGRLSGSTREHGQPSGSTREHGQPSGPTRGRGRPRKSN